MLSGAVLLGDSSPQPNWLPATVTSYTAGSTLTVTLDGAVTAVNANLAWNDTFAAGDRIWVTRVGTKLIVVGRQNYKGAAVSSLPVGTLLATMASTADAGFLMLDGSTHNATDFPAFALKVYGISVGTFTLPDARGKTLAAFLTSDPVFGTMFASVGEAANSHTHAGGSHTHSGPSHQHTFAASHAHTSAAHGHTLSGNGSANVAVGSSNVHIDQITVAGWTPGLKLSGTQAADGVGITAAARLAGSTDSATPGNTGSSSPGTSDLASGTTGAGSATTATPSDTLNVQPTIVIGGWQVKT